MKKRLLFVAFLMLQLIQIKAQSLINAPDTVCIRQPIQLTSNAAASSYFWGFCSGYLMQNPVQSNLGVMPSFNQPTAIDVAKDGANYYGFVANSGTGELVRLDYGNSLANTPTVVNFGTINNTIPLFTTKLNLIKDADGNWFMFACGGSNNTNSSIARIDFGKSLSNNPNVVNFGDFGGELNSPRGIFVQEQNGNYIGYVANNVDNKLLKLNFGPNISFTPVLTNLGTTFALDNASDMALVKENGEWFAFATNQTSNKLVRLDFGTDLNVNPVANDLGDLGGKLFGPTSISISKDCGSIHLMITNGVSNNVTMADISDIKGAYTARILLGTGAMAIPSSISRIIRDRNDVYVFVTNVFDNTLTRLVFSSCTSSNIASATTALPPVFQYSTPGTFNLYLAINEGLPTMQVECRQIVVLPMPQMTFHNDTTICQGDTLKLFMQAYGSLSQTWYPNYNISDTANFAVKVWPEFSTNYHVVLPYTNGCIVDTPVKVTVSKIKADAGADRVLFDGASTLLGGPMTTVSDSVTLFTYNWFPDQNLTANNIPNPVASPTTDFTYYLEVRNSFGCYDIDTVIVGVNCNSINLPNAFLPESKNSNTNTFGVLNNQIVKLNYFIIFDRWGKKMFETTDLTKGWNGVVDGNPAPVGVYIWEADGFCAQGKRIKRSGNVTLIR